VSERPTSCQGRDGTTLAYQPNAALLVGDVQNGVVVGADSVTPRRQRPQAAPGDAEPLTEEPGGVNAHPNATEELFKGSGKRGNFSRHPRLCRLHQSGLSQQRWPR
jgi:hypothetical protein